MARARKNPKQLSVYEVESEKALAFFNASEKSPGLWAVIGALFHPDCQRTFRLVRWGSRRPITSLSVGMIGGKWKTPHEAAQAVRFAALVEGEETRIARERAEAGEPALDILDLRVAAYRAVGARAEWGFTPEQMELVVGEFRASAARLGG